MDNKGPKPSGGLPKGTTAKDSNTPGFLGGAGGGEKPVGLSDRNEKGAAVGINAERAATEQNLEQNEDSLDGVREDEASVSNRGFYTGSGGVALAAVTASVPKSFFQNKGVIGLIISAFIMVAAATVPSFFNPLLSLVENGKAIFGQSSAVLNRRSNFIMTKLLKTNKKTTSKYGEMFDLSKSPKLVANLKQQGIYYVEAEDADGAPIKMLVHEGSDGKVTAVVASDADVPKADTFKGRTLDIDGGSRKITITEGSMSLATAKSKNPDFNTKYSSATLESTGKIAGWFDNPATLLFKRKGGNRARNQLETEGEVTREKADELFYKNGSDGEDNTDTKYRSKDNDTESEVSKDSDGDVIDSDGKKVMTIDDNGDSVPLRFDDVSDAADANNTLKTGADVDTVKAGLTAKAQKVAMVGSSAGCSVLRAVGAISASLGAIQAINTVQYTLRYLELSDRIKYGESTELSNYVMNDIHENRRYQAVDVNGNLIDEEGSIIESPGWNQFFARRNIVNEDDPSAMMVNRENGMKIAIKNSSLMDTVKNLDDDEHNLSNAIADATSSVALFGSSITAFRICNGIQLVAGAIDFIGDVVLAITTFGSGNFVKEFIGGAVKGIKLAAVMGALTVFIGAVSPILTSWLATSLKGLLASKVGGYALLSGFQNITNSNLIMSTGTLATKQNAIELFTMTREVEKEWAEYDRATLSPFDTSSQYTFLGSIVNSLTPLMNMSKNSVFSPLSTVASLAGSSALAMISPQASAVDETTDFAQSLASDENCTNLASVEVAGDFACNKYGGAHNYEIENMDPEDAQEWMDEIGSFDGEDEYGNPKVNPDSEYATWLIACAVNDAQPGTISGAVQGFLEDTTTTDSVTANALLGIGMNFVPFEGALDTATAIEVASNIDWNSQQACTKDKYKYYSIYNLDQRVLESMGLTQSNSTVSFLEEYYEQNPIDYSFEGQIARNSGLSKEEVVAVMDALEYFEYIAEYDPTTRYAFGQEIKPASAGELKFDNDQKVAYVVLLNTIEFADVRNRSFVV